MNIRRLKEIQKTILAKQSGHGFTEISLTLKDRINSVGEVSLTKMTFEEQLVKAYKIALIINWTTCSRTPLSDEVYELEDEIKEKIQRSRRN